MQNEQEVITYEQAKKLIADHNGTLLSKLSILPPLEVYELDDSRLITIKVYSKTATLFSDGSKAKKELESKRPKGLFEDYQDSLKGFPANKDAILKDLSIKLGIAVDPTSVDKKYLDGVSRKISEYSIDKAQREFFLGMVVLMGEGIIKKKGGEWKTSTNDYPYPQLEPYIQGNDGKKIDFFIRIISKALWGDEKIDWYTMTIFAYIQPSFVEKNK